MTKASDNDYPSILVTEQGSAPASPAASHQRMYIRTSDHTLVTVNSSGTVTPVAGSGLTDPMTTRGDIIVRNASNVTARLAIGAAGTVLKGGTDVAYAYPPGYEFDYVEFTANVSITATTEATANTIVTSNAVTYDGSTLVKIEFECVTALPPLVAGGLLDFYLYEKVGAGAAASIGLIGELASQNAANSLEVHVRPSRRMTPSAASIIYSIRARVSSGTGTVAAGAGGNAATMPGSIRITKV